MNNSVKGTQTFDSFECASLRLSPNVLLLEHLSRQAVLKTLLLQLLQGNTHYGCYGWPTDPITINLHSPHLNVTDELVLHLLRRVFLNECTDVHINVSLDYTKVRRIRNRL